DQRGVGDGALADDGEDAAVLGLALLEEVGRHGVGAAVGGGAGQLALEAEAGVGGGDAARERTLGLHGQGEGVAVGADGAGALEELVALLDAALVVAGQAALLI